MDLGLGWLHGTGVRLVGFGGSLEPCVVSFCFLSVVVVVVVDDIPWPPPPLLPPLRLSG
jgi:hypothetical protein